MKKAYYYRRRVRPGSKSSRKMWVISHATTHEWFRTKKAMIAAYPLGTTFLPATVFP